MSATRRLLSILVTPLLLVGCSGPERTPDSPAANVAAAPRAAHTASPTAPQHDPHSTEPTMSEPDAKQTSPAGDADARGAAAPQPTTEVATFGGGCFWCTEAVLEQLDGVLEVTAGYMGGTVDAPTYEQVCGGTTGHAEVVQVTFDPQRIAYEALLDWFFRSHDPTTLNRQGADVGTQYRSVVFTHSDRQAKLVAAKIRELAPQFGDRIVTEVTTASKFWSAEAYHQDYFRNNPSRGYCRAVIAPKLHKLGLDAAGGR